MFPSTPGVVTGRITLTAVVERARRRGQPPAALEQPNDTKELSRAQRPLGAGGKVVGNSVTGPDIADIGVPGGDEPAPGAVDGARAAHRPSTGYPQVFPHR